MRVQVLAAAMLAAGVAGCGTITRGTDEPVAFLSEPPGATVTTTKGYACPATPCTIKVERSDEFDVTFMKPGYQPQTVPVRREVVGKGAMGMAGNVIAGGVIGIGVDAATGAAFDHKPNPVSVVLVPEDMPAKPVRRGRRKAVPEG